MREARGGRQLPQTIGLRATEPGDCEIDVRAKIYASVPDEVNKWLVERIACLGSASPGGSGYASRPCAEQPSDRSARRGGRPLRRGARGDALGGELELQDRSEARVDLCPHGNLAGRDLVQADLRNADLAGANLTGAKLTRANLATAKLVRAKLTRARLDLANLTFANLVGSRCERCESLTRDSERWEPRPRESLRGQPDPRESRGREPGRCEPRSREPRGGEPGRCEPRRRQSHRRNPQHGFAGRDEPQPRELDPSRARERDLERRVSDRRESLRRKPAGRDGDGRGSLEGEPRRREARRRRLVRHHLPERAEDDDSLLSPGAWFRRGRSGRSECSCCRSRRSTSPARGRRRTGLCPRSPPGHSPRRRTSRGRAR